MRALGYRPHFTFAIYDSPEIDAKTAWQAMLRAVKDEAQLSIEFKRIRWFVGPPMVLWAEPALDQALVRWHASISATVDPLIVGLTIGPELGPLIAHLARASLMRIAKTLWHLPGLSTDVSGCYST